MCGHCETGVFQTNLQLDAEREDVTMYCKMNSCFQKCTDLFVDQQNDPSSIPVLTQCASRLQSTYPDLTHIQCCVIVLCDQRPLCVQQRICQRSLSCSAPKVRKEIDISIPDPCPNSTYQKLCPKRRSDVRMRISVSTRVLWGHAAWLWISCRRRCSRSRSCCRRVGE